MAAPRKLGDGDGEIRRSLRTLHRRVMENDPTALGEVASLLRARLVACLSRHFGRKVDDQIIEERVDQVLLEYGDKPHKFNPKKRVPLDRFLAMVAKRYVLNSLRGEKRRKARESKVAQEKLNSKKGENSVELELSAVYIGHAERESAAQLFLDSVESSLPNSKDKPVLRLRRQGQTDLRRYAEVMGTRHLALNQQRSELKRIWDRIVKFAKRKAEAEGFKWPRREL